MKAFVLMPFDSEFDTVFDDLIRQPLEEAGYLVERADTGLDQRNILQDVVEGIARADLIIADLTASNPNVFYELGVCHGLGIPTVLITQSMEDVPFDLRSYRCFPYSTHFQNAPALRERLKEIGEQHRDGKLRFGSPVTDHLETHTPRVEEREESETHETEDVLAEAEAEENGLLDFVVEGEASATQIGEVVTELATGLNSLGSKTNAHTRELETLGDGSSQGSAVRANRIALSVAKDMTEYSDLVRDRLPDLESATDSFFDNSTGYIDWLSNRSDNAEETILSFRKTITELLKATGYAISGVRSYRESAINLRKTKISRAIGRASVLLTQATDRLIGVFERIEAYCTKLLGEINSL